MGLPVRLSRGAVFAQDFEVTAQLAEGGMGTVYQVVDRTNGETRALKVLLPELIADEKTRERFSQEAQIAAQIESPHVPRIFRAGIDDTSGTPWILMELLRGGDLRRWVKEHGPLTVARTQVVLEQLCDALAAAHARGLVHRDLKPENVFLAVRDDGTQEVKLLDFGIAKVLDLHRTSGVGTGAIGSPMWMAPEQTSAGGRIAPSTDVFALALVSFYTMTGAFYWKSAHDGSGVGGLLRELHVDDPVAPSVRAAEIGKRAPFWPAFDAWFVRATMRKGAERFRDAAEALEALQAAFAQRPDRSAMAFATTVELGPAPPDTMNTGPMEPHDAAVMRGFASDERHDTYPTDAFADASSIPPTDPPEPGPTPEMPQIPRPAPLPYAYPPPSAPAPSSRAPWIAGVLAMGCLAALLSGALVWMLLVLYADG
jgi:serine/threonine protein kinase